MTMKRLLVGAVMFALAAPLGLVVSAALESQTPSFDFLVRANQRDVWTAPYDTALDQYDSALGWISGDRWGYRCMFTFLEYNGELVARVTFAAIPEAAAYVSMQTRHGFIEGNRFYDGTLNTTGSKQTGAPEDCIRPGPYEPLAGDPGPLPVITFSDAADGHTLEVRDYNNAAAASDAQFVIASASPELVVVVAYQAGVPVAAVYYELMPGVTAVTLTSNLLPPPPPPTTPPPVPADCAFLTGETESGHQVSATVCI